MKSIKTRNEKWVFAVVFVLCLALTASTATSGICENALQSCLPSAVFSGFLTFSISGIGFKVASCILGYQWCLRYIDIY